MTQAGTLKRFFPALIFALLVSGSQASAQSTATTKDSGPAKESTPTTIKSDKADQAEPAAVDQQDVITPPAPMIIKSNSRSVSIPAEETRREPKYEERPATMSSSRIGSLYGYRRDPFTRRAKFHSGIDIKARSGDPVGASHPGTVQFTGWYYGYGNLVIVDHGGGVTTYYAHLSSFEVIVGDKVERGVVVGYAGRTGRATSPHLHYEVRLDGEPINPLLPVALDESNDFFKEPEPVGDMPDKGPTSAANEEK